MKRKKKDAAYYIAAFMLHYVGNHDNVIIVWFPP